VRSWLRKIGNLKVLISRIRIPEGLAKFALRLPVAAHEFTELGGMTLKILVRTSPLSCSSIVTAMPISKISQTVVVSVPDFLRLPTGAVYLAGPSNDA
jgi:hypothetical protein